MLDAFRAQLAVIWPGVPVSFQPLPHAVRRLTVPFAVHAFGGLHGLEGPGLSQILARKLEVRHVLRAVPARHLAGARIRVRLLANNVVPEDVHAAKAVCRACACGGRVCSVVKASQAQSPSGRPRLTLVTVFCQPLAESDWLGSLFCLASPPFFPEPSLAKCTPVIYTGGAEHALLG